ncbi:MAG TPA: hypothetical protein VF273_10290, partial [Pelobium sp.]
MAAKAKADFFAVPWFLLLLVWRCCFTVISTIGEICLFLCTPSVHRKNLGISSLYSFVARALRSWLACPHAGQWHLLFSFLFILLVRHSSMLRRFFRKKVNKKLS